MLMPNHRPPSREGHLFTDNTECADRRGVDLARGAAFVIPEWRRPGGEWGTFPFGQVELMPIKFGLRFFPSLRVPSLLHDVDEIRMAPVRGSARPRQVRLQGRSVIWSCKDKLR